MAVEPLVSLEIGTHTVRVLVGEFRQDGHLLITGIGEVPSRGVRKGEIVNFDAAASCLKDALDSAEEQSRTAIRSVYLAVGGPHIRSQVNRGQIPVIPAGSEISREHVHDALESARAVSIPEDRVIVHTIRQRFVVDEHSEVLDPTGMSGSRLDAYVLAIHGLKNRISDLAHVVAALDVDVADAAFSGLCAALAVMSPEQKENGSLLLDLGGGTTDYLVYADRAIVAAGSLGIGGDHVSNDIAVGLGSIALSTAEEVKVRYGRALVSAGFEETVPLGTRPGQETPAYRRDLEVIINARLSELFEIVREILAEQGLLPRLGAGVILTGGGARMDGIVDLCRQVIGLPCTVGLPRDVSGLAVAGEAPEYATAVGLLKYAYRARGERLRPPLIRRLLERLPLGR